MRYLISCLKTQENHISLLFGQKAQWKIQSALGAQSQTKPLWPSTSYSAKSKYEKWSYLDGIIVKRM